MKSEIDQLATLRRMRNEGRITDDEYEDLTRGLLAVADAPAPGHEPDDTVHEGAEPDGELSATGPFPLRFRQDLSVGRLGVMLIAALVLVAVSAVGLVSWYVGLPALMVLLTTLLEGWRNATIVGIVAVVVILLIGFVGSIGNNDSPVVDQTAAGTLPPQDPFPPIAGSLGIYIDQVTELWNTVDGPPQMNQGLTRYNEPGEYDTFLYRFGEWGRVAGAFDPETEAVYALFTTGWFVGDATDRLYLHLCFVVAPYSQECIDAYNQHGLDGGTLEDFTDIDHEAEWELGDHTWLLETENNILTIRVYGEDAA